MESNTPSSSASTGSECHPGKLSHPLVHSSCVTHSLTTRLAPPAPRSLTLQVDEGHRKSVSLQPGGSSHWARASFFIGGLPKEEESGLPIKLQKSLGSFRGCIQYLVLGGV